MTSDLPEQVLIGSVEIKDKASILITHFIKHLIQARCHDQGLVRTPMQGQLSSAKRILFEHRWENVGANVARDGDDRGIG